jgi:hypothetical protein
LLEDLQGPAASNRILLDMQDQQRLFSTTDSAGDAEDTAQLTVRF